MGNAEPKNGRKREMPQAEAGVLDAAVEPANGSMREATQRMPREAEPATIEAPEMPVRETREVERLGNDGNPEKWDDFEVVNGQGEKMHYLKKAGVERHAILTDSEYQLEQEMQAETKKFAEGKAWDSFTTLLLEGGDENASLKGYLDQNKGRILEFACFMAMNEQISKEQALSQTAQEVKTAVSSGEGKGHFELDYSAVAKALNVSTRDFLLRESGTVDAKLQAEDRVGVIISRGFDEIGGRSNKENTASMATADKAEVARLSMDNERMWGALVDGELTAVSSGTEDDRSLEEMQAVLLHELKSATTALKDGKSSPDSLRATEQRLLENLNLFRLAGGRKMAEKVEDLSGEWKDFLHVSAETKAEKGASNEAVEFPTATPAIQEAKRKRTSKQRAANSEDTELQPTAPAAFSEGPVRAQGAQTLDESVAEVKRLLAKNREATELANAKKSPARKPVEVAVEYEATNPNIAPNEPVAPLSFEEGPEVTEIISEADRAKTTKVTEFTGDMLANRAKKIRARKPKAAPQASQTTEAPSSQSASNAPKVEGSTPGFVSLQEQAKRTENFVPNSELPPPGAELTEMTPTEIAVAKENAKNARTRRVPSAPKPFKKASLDVATTIVNQEASPRTLKEQVAAMKTPSGKSSAWLETQNADFIPESDPIEPAQGSSSFMEVGEASAPGWLETQNPEVIPLPEKVKQEKEPERKRVPFSGKAAALERNFDARAEKTEKEDEERLVRKIKPNIFRRMWDALAGAEDNAFNE